MTAQHTAATATATKAAGATGAVPAFGAPLAARLHALEPLGYALLRVSYAGVILTHGLPKVLRLPHGSIADPIAATTGLIQRALGLPFAAELAWAVALLETVGAALLAAGWFTRPIALAFVGQMLGICLALGPTWPWTDRGIEYPVVLGVLAAYMVLRGGGPYSVDGHRRGL